MTAIAKHLVPVLEPIADPAAIVAVGSVRFTVLASRLIRMEYSANGEFEDRASQVFLFRKQPVPRFTKSITATSIEIITDDIHLTYHPSSDGFSDASLSVKLLACGPIWHYGDKDRSNLRGTLRTLDMVDGASALEPGLMSRDGWTVVDDCASLVFDKNGWLVKRETQEHETHDLYFFGYGNDYRGCLKEFCQVAGPIPLIPRWVFGNWWSRYWEYSESDLRELIADFKAHELPLSVCIIDMDWHIVKNNFTGGWTGYTWDRKFFPDPQTFLDWLHSQNVRTGLNLHPHDGVHPHEQAYPEIAAHMGMDPSSNKPVSFDIADPHFAQGYFEKLHHPLEKQGIDFWWMDWQQGTVKGLDPLFHLNHLHFLDLSRDGARRPFVFSRWGGLGNHRYPIGFSGDSSVTWTSLAFQPYMTATAANVGYCYWSHDIGGHQNGTEDEELFTRWIQFGAFSPVLRIHSTKNEFVDRRPWTKGKDAFAAIRKAMQFRHALVPYIYASAYRTTMQADPLIKPMYYDFPDAEEAYCAVNQYQFGSELLVAPFSKPIDPDTRYARQVVWLPKGDWYHFFTGEHIQGGRFVAEYGKLDDVPVFARAGAIVPLSADAFCNDCPNPRHLEVQVFAGVDHTFDMYEDDGVSSDFRKGLHSLTHLQQHYTDKRITFRVTRSGDASFLPPERQWTFVVTGVSSATMAAVVVDGEAVTTATAYDSLLEKLTIKCPSIPIDGVIEVVLTTKTLLLSRRNRQEEKCKKMLQHFKAPSTVKRSIREISQQHYSSLNYLQSAGTLLTKSQTQALAEVAGDAGHEYIDTIGEEKILFAWNNQQRDGVRLDFASASGHQNRTGAAPRFWSVRIGEKRDDVLDKNDLWKASVDYFGAVRAELGRCVALATTSSQTME